MAENDKSEDRLRQVEERFRLFMENVREYAVFMLDPEGRVVDWNLGAEKVLGYREDIVGQPFAVFFPPADRQDGVPERELRIAAETGRASDDRWHVRKDGTYFWAMGVTTAMRDEHGALKGFTKVLRDSTERKHFEEELDKRNEALAEANRRKDEFLASLAHELRNPLAAVFNAFAIVGQENVPDDVRRQTYPLIERQLRHLSRLVDDLMDVSRISRGRIQLRKQRIDLKTAIENAVEACRTLIDAKRHQLSTSIPTDIWLEADATRIEQVFVNLLTNAAKYSADGSVISITVAQETLEAVTRIRDTGMGIAPDLLPHIFELFTQADRSLDRSEGGLGIGLAIVRKLIELHDGSVEANSNGIGKGSEFVVRLPVTQDVPEMKIETPQTPDQVPLRILVVDDNMDSAMTMRMALALKGHQVEAAHDGPAAIQVAEDQKPDVILMDIGLPGLNGYQVAERLRASPDLKKITLVAMTGYGQEDDRKRSKQAGFDHHMVKPVDHEHLHQLIALIGQQRRAEE